MSDFIFGTLATDALRRQHVDKLRSGITHLQQRSPRHPLPGQTIQLHLTSGPLLPGSRAWVYWTTDGSDPIGVQGVAFNGRALEMQFSQEEWDTVSWGYLRHFTVELPAQPDDTLVRYRLSCYSPAQGEIFADNGAYYAFYVETAGPPAWTQSAVIYQVFPDRFFPGSHQSWQRPASLGGFFGGTLRGILDKLDYISELGCNTIWLNPIFPSPSHHGYDATDLFSVEPRLGTLPDFTALLAAAHQSGIRILLDFVPNHWSHLHPTFQNAIADANSPYHNWYTFRHWPDEYETFFGVKSLPQINLRNPAARQHMLEAAKYWLDLGLDGYRLDYAIGPAPDFWADFRRVTRAANPQSWTFGEVVDPPDVQIAFEGQLDGCLDFVLLEGLRKALAYGSWDGVEFGRFLERHTAYFPVDFSRPSFLDNHDMNRFLWAAQGDKRRLRLAALCQFTLPGQPVIYYGTEVGLSQQRDVRQGERGVPEESRLPMLWGEEQDLALLEFYRSLISLRHSQLPLQIGSLQIIQAQPGLLVYARHHDNDRIGVALNLTAESAQVNLQLPVRRTLLTSEDGVTMTTSDNQPWTILPPLSGVVWQI